MENVAEVSEIVQQMLKDDNDKLNTYAKIKNAVDCVFVPDSAVSELPFIQGRSFALTDIADARNAGTRAFTSLLPNISISPVSDNEGEYDRTEKMEQAWKWEMEKLNRPSNGKKGVHDQIVQSAITYHRVALQTEYLPHKFKGREKDNRIKAILARKCHQWTVQENPGEVHAKYSDYGLERVAKVSEYSAQQLIDNFGKENEAVLKLMEDVKGNQAERMRTMFTLVDYTDWEDRLQYAVPKGGSVTVGTNNKRYEFMNEKHGMPFINWVIVDYEEPLWEAVLKSGHWDNLQHMKLIKFSRAVALGARPDFAIQTTDGTLKGVWLDYKNPLNPLVLPPGAQVVPFQSPQLDQQFEAEYQEDRQDVSRSTVARILQDPTPFLNAPFSTFNASITSALGQLAPAKMTAEAAEAESIYQGFQWIKFSKKPFSAYRAKSGDSKIENSQPYHRGGQIVITHEDPPTAEQVQKMNEREMELFTKKVFFDLDGLYIKVELRSANMTDEQARINTLLLAVREGNMSKKEMWERMAWEGFDMNQMQRAAEILMDTEVQKVAALKMLEVEKKKMEMQAQMQMQQQAQQMQMQQAAMQQQQNPQNAMNEMNAGNQFMSMQGQDLRGGGMAAAQMAPNETNVSITGQTEGGGAVI